MGYEVCQLYQKLAYQKLNDHSFTVRGEKDRIISSLKAKGREKEIESSIQKMLANTKFTSVPKDLCYLEGTDVADYLFDMGILERFADLNRLAMIQDIIDYLGLHSVNVFTTQHNYIDLNRYILRKGAVSAERGQRLIIPMNMRDGSLICEGLGNPEWNYSAPHGAGRLMSRSKAKSSLSMEDFRDSMKDIYSTTVVQSTIDESPMAYKPVRDIVSQIGDTVVIKKIIKPIYNCKAASC